MREWFLASLAFECVSASTQDTDISALLRPLRHGNASQIESPAAARRTSLLSLEDLGRSFSRWSSCGPVLESPSFMCSLAGSRRLDDEICDCDGASRLSKLSYGRSGQMELSWSMSRCPEDEIHETRGFYRNGQDSQRFGLSTFTSGFKLQVQSRQRYDCLQHKRVPPLT